MKLIHLLIVSCIFSFSVQAKYLETIQNAKTEKNLVKDYGLKADNAASDQSNIVQHAIDDLAAKGGGILNLPKGTYSFMGIYLKSNVHLVVDKGVTIKPFIHKSQVGNGVFQLSNQSTKPKGEEGFIENVSIRCKQKGEYFIIDYSHIEKTVKGKPGTSTSARAIKCGQVRNFLLEGIYIKDNWTRHCAVIFVPAKVPGCDKWEVYKPTAGFIHNLKSTNSSPGYGLTQLHGGYDLHFENLSTTNGGITFRLETGAGGHYGGVDQITAENIYCENGATAMAMGPHTAINGMVKVKNITAVSCGTAFQCGPGFNDGRDNSNKPGRFADGCTIDGIHAIYGEKAPYHTKGIADMEDWQLSKLWFEKETELIRGPSRWIARDKTGDSWDIIIKNVKAEGYPASIPEISSAPKEAKKNFREILKNYPIWKDLPDYLTDPAKAKQKKKH